MKAANTKYAEYYQIYVWELPVRFYHWINALCIAVLAATGYLIGQPIAIHSSAEASFQYWFGTVRFLHFLFAFIFFFNFLYRIYWGFVGNSFAGWKTFIPYTRQHWKEILHVMCLDVLQICQKPLKSIGHNALAGFTYFMTFLVFLFQAVTGFGLYSAMSDIWFTGLFTWIVPLMGGEIAVRQWQLLQPSEHESSVKVAGPARLELNHRNTESADAFCVDRRRYVPLQYRATAVFTQRRNKMLQQSGLPAPGSPHQVDRAHIMGGEQASDFAAPASVLFVDIAQHGYLHRSLSPLL